MPNHSLMEKGKEIKIWCLSMDCHCCEYKEVIGGIEAFVIENGVIVALEVEEIGMLNLSS